VKAETGLNVAASLGILDRDQAKRLAEGGVHRYNHNLETSRSFFPEIVTTHTFDERFETCMLVREVGMELCCGALLGMGETDEQRIELLSQLRDVEPAEKPLEAIKWIALFRLALPEVILRYAGGREVTLRELQAMGMTAGINALIVGNYLTTLGRKPQQDLQMLDDLRMPIGVLSKVI
jgi:biotin synthase